LKIDDLSSFAKISKITQIIANHETEFDAPLYNVWKQQKKTKGSTHAGNTEVTFVDNLLYLYTKPFDVIVDPFVGGGSSDVSNLVLMELLFLHDRNPLIELLT
jgi:hypothetical protein